MNRPKNAKPVWAIYKITNLINGKTYIGKDKYNNPKYFGSGLILKQAIKKYGIENFKKDVLQFCPSEDSYNDREIYWIKELNSFYPNGYNINTGGKGGDNFTNHPEKEKLLKIFSESKKGIKQSEETLIKRSIAMKGKPQTPCGKTICPHCNYTGDIRNLVRWHFDNCKALKGVEIKRCPFCSTIIKKCNHVIHYDNCIKNPNVDMDKYLEVKNNYMKHISKEKKYTHTEEHKKIMSLKMMGRFVSDKTRELQRLAFKKRWNEYKKETHKCKYCDKQSNSKPNIDRWHNENCKHKPSLHGTL